MLRLVLDTIPLLVYWKDRELRYMGVNKAFLDFFGFPREEAVLGKKDAHILERQDHAPARGRRRPPGHGHQPPASAHGVGVREHPGGQPRAGNHQGAAATTGPDRWWAS